MYRNTCIMHLSVVVFLLYFDSIIFVNGRGYKHETNHITGLSLLKSQNEHRRVSFGAYSTIKSWSFFNKSREATIIDLKKSYRKKSREIAFEAVGYSKKLSYSTLVGIHLKNKKLPLAELSLDILKRKVILRYQGDKSFQRVTLTFGPELVDWNVLSAVVNRTHFTVRLGCHIERSVKLTQRLQKIPKKAVAVLGSGKTGEDPFFGELLQAKLYTYAVSNDQLLCAQPGSVLFGEDGYLGDEPINGDRILLLEQQITLLNKLVDSLKQQNVNLSDRVEELETCCDSGCEYQGQVFDEGQTWSPDKCTVCICSDNKPDCLRRTDIPSCQSPCETNPCMNYGQCVSFDETQPNNDFQCLCQPPYDGQYCEQKANPCVWPRESGICDQNIPRYYYDTNLQECLPFNYTGCGGNINNYESLSACEAVAVIGACCYRHYSLKVEDVIVSSQQESDSCKEITLSECQSTHRHVLGDTRYEVTSFYPGETCDNAQCGSLDAVCMIEDKKYEVGEKAILGCQECTCESSGQFVCSCSQKAVRKEIRDMTSQELAQFQAAIQELRLVGPGNPWEELRDIYMRHTMHSNGGPYFLPWHRIFLRRLEQKLQEIDCSITLPYYDFTTDIGNFENAIIWQPNYFGGDGVDGCVVDHPFGPRGAWRPCISRQFNNDVKLPTLLELSLAIASDDYIEMSRCLEAYVSYIHTYIGGDMATRAASYDPVFYTIHAYIDMLYWWWQKKGDNMFKYPPEFGNIPMVPFNIPPSAILDLENDLCVKYTWPSEGTPCNKTVDGDFFENGNRERGDVNPVGDTSFTGGFNSFGYDASGFDRRGYGQDGFQKNGYNRDSYDKDGYDVDGYNRYGYDRDGYSRYGYDIEGWDRDNMPDTTARYNAYGVDMNCLDRRGYTTSGLDRYGFNQRGYNHIKCDYFYNGPYATIQSKRIWGIMLVQTKSFLMSLHRTCPPLEHLPINWLQQYWITDIKNVTDMVQVGQSTSEVLNSRRFCFDIDDFVRACECDVGIATCEENPCLKETCPSYPEATCHIDFCGVCRANWYVNGGQVDCFEERDFCQPNPCENGGTCVHSIWPSEAQLTTCICPPGFDGHYCQYKSLDICELPISTGNCGLQETRWYFDRETQTCETFLYTGCTGNVQNFRTKDQCEARCRIGACCYRYLKDRDQTIGYDGSGYDMYGFDVGGQNRRGDVRIESNGIKTGRDRFQYDRYDWQGYDRNGFDRNGYNRWGLDKSGYDREGFNLTGYNRQGEYDGITDYDGSGYDPEGYNRAGFTCGGSNRDGLNAYEVYSEYVYKCRPATLQQCQALEDDNKKIVKFSRGQRCEDVDCSETCGCYHNNKMYKFGETWRAGCQFCTCTYTGAVECSCSQIFRRKEVRDMTPEEMKKYQNAIKSLSKTEFPSRWFQFSKLYADHKAQAVGNSGSLPWHRQFLRTVEQALQETDCSITIPYYDWTLNAGDQQRARIWAADMFSGDGSDSSACVRYHPFKDYYPPYWVPCLRRRFNTSLPLPDVIDLQIAVNEPDYNRFRLHMELYLNMFTSWVGGHMGSDHSPYDPLFLSVVAFIDRVWWDWQNTHPNSLLAYPQELRYVPMMPFKSSPDDVMDSKKQMCVTYYPLSEGAACNVTLPNLNYNSLGYDRHGFDREGYDIEGYNVFGENREGENDDRGIYNVFDFDREGFKRNGYDSMGLDRYGFTVDNYNVDGYDSRGFDRTGYNRYGYNREGYTPFGFNRNGSSNVDLRLNGYDPYGYNRYGLDVYGFDRQGYDTFGFDTHGYDRNQCNHYFLGPMLVIVKSMAKLQLENIDDKTMRIITRICPALNYLPEWRYTVNWLRRGSQVPLIEGIVGRAQERALGLRPDIQTGSVTSESQWLPVGPDRSLCFVTYHYTECPFGEPPVDCIEDLCVDRACPGFPDAVCRVNRCGSCKLEWYNGRTGNPIQCSGCIDRSGIERGESTEWSESDCETCACQDGLVSCKETICSPVLCTHPVKIPGQCCLSCQDCDYDGTKLRNGQTYSPPENRCDVCMCNQGNVNCHYVDCPDLGSCTSELTLEGECCPTCLDCGDRSNGESWKETACQECTCVDGRVECERIHCIPPDCSHPRTPPGECCPACDGCMADGRDLRDGETYMPDQCTQCNCRFGNVLCDPVPCPFIACLNPITPPGECCPRCDLECVYDDRTYRHGEVFLSTEDRCTNCSCENTIVKCQPVSCPRMDLRCRRPITLPGDCCPSKCPTCLSEGREFETGDRWTSLLDPCETCVCEEGISSCTRIERCPRQCDHGIVKTGECCSKCRDCIYLGLRVNDGQSFLQPGDACQQCSCIEGQVTCQYLGPCPRLSCTVTETAPGACCPQCKVCEYRGDLFYHGDTVSSDPCSTCYCRDGEVTCSSVSCARTSCRSPVVPPGECCPICLECDYNGLTYQDGERFSPLLEPCLTCECRGGEVRCASKENECPLTRCTHPIKSRGQCCPSCDGCSYLRRRLRNGQKFVPPGNDNCKVCRCRSGSVECNNMGCPAVNCDNAVLVKGQCCPVCPMGCNVMGIEYRDGQTFIDFMDRCKVCTCMMGRIRCMAMMSCPPTQCTHPANRPGNCCPSCTKCEVNNVLYRNGETFTNPGDTCEECSCRDGSVTCRAKSVSCPRVNCVDPELDPNTCCWACPARACTYNGRQYGDGQEVLASQDSCEMCKCKEGMIECEQRECPAVYCRHPGRDQCCDVCDFCMYSGMRIELGEMFPDPYDHCEECVCKAGTVQCDRKVCGVPNCRNPSYPPGSCCPVCTDCTFQGFMYKNGEDFQNPSRACERCLCMEGRVACDTRRCTQVTCRYPVLVDCCPVCTDCMYGSTRYQNGERFTHADGCGQCMCSHGDVTCDDVIPCAPVTCNHPVTTNCCRQCTDCQYKENIIENGRRFIDNDDACKQCVCENGSVSCDLLLCQPVSCDNPVRGRCCPECTDCNYYGQIVKDGAEIASVIQDCEVCQCIMGNLTCRQKSCPTVSCSHPTVDECCHVCEHCFFNRRTYNNLEIFLNDLDRCQQCVCEFGSVTCSDICVTDSCNHGDRTYDDGESFSSLLDECEECICERGRTRCYQRPCPVTTCTHPSLSGCCPRCEDCTDGNMVHRNGEIFRQKCSGCSCLDGNISCTPIPCDVHVCIDTVLRDCCQQRCEKSCIYQGRVYNDGDVIPPTVTPCEQCVCQEGDVICEDIVCPVCSDGQGEVSVPGQCCPRCENIKQNVCEHDGEYVQEGHVWNVDECTSCVCKDGVVTCTGQQCPPLECESNNVPISVPGTCCPVCAPKAATCIVYGDPHYRTFDGTTIHFQGTCKYIMSSDCRNKDFIVEVQHDNRGIEDVSWAQNFTIKIGTFRIDLLQNLVVQVNGRMVKLPYTSGTRFSIEKHNNNVLVNTDIGLQFVWDGSSRAELSVPGQYKRRTCGLCGNFNGYPHDDLQTVQGEITSSMSIFGNSWKTSDQNADNCVDGVDVDPCVVRGFRARRQAETLCEMIRSPWFSACHSIVSFEPYYDSCVYDLCACVNQTACLCDILATYSSQCAKSGVRLQWRSHTFCAMDCDTDKGFVFDDCGPVCHRSCDNWQTPLGNLTENCNKPCVAGCQCTADKVVHHGECIPINQCPNYNTVT